MGKTVSLIMSAHIFFHHLNLSKSDKLSAEMVEEGLASLSTNLPNAVIVMTLALT